MIVALALVVLGLVAFVTPVGRARVFVGVAVAGLLGALLADAVGVTPPARLLEAVERVDVLGLAPGGVRSRLLLVAALVWSGPAGDLVVRTVLLATGLPNPESAAAAGVRAGRWLGRLERWMLVVVVAAGQPGLAFIPTGGKALFRYAETVAEARASRDRIAAPTGPSTAPTRDVLLDYVLVGSLTSWAQAVVLGLLVATAA